MLGKRVILQALLATSVSLVEAIYSDDHWNYSKKLTASTFETTVQSEIDAGRTLFAPAWNEITKAFSGSKDVSFGDVNLREERVSGAPHNPGSGGWPTVRYFNKATGPEGGNYVKKTSKSMCDELGDVEMMRAYIEEYGNITTCSIVDGEGCDDKELAYIEKMKSNSHSTRMEQLERLEGMEKKSMKDDLKKWVAARRKILEQFAEAGSDEL